jgi:GDP-mannose 6-dehydrogenase
MRVSIFGIGYVGSVSAACMARDGHAVVAVDTNADKVASIAAGQSPIIEKDLPELIAEQVSAGRLTASVDADAAMASTDMSLICVGSPSGAHGMLDLTQVLAVAAQIGEALKRKSTRHTVVFRSTMLPGSMDGSVIPALEKASGMKAGVDFGIGYYPEFLRESTAIADYDTPGAAVFGTRDQATLEALHALQPGLQAPIAEVDLNVAEAIKYFNNAWHAAKISFANEAGNICHALGIDSHAVMEVLCSDKRLNISAAYLRPGFAFGGSCLPKDLRALRHSARQHNVPTPLLDGVVAANDIQIERAFQMVEAAGSRRIGLVGLSFKPGTDDLRESPVVILAERMIGKGYALKIFDENIRLSRLTGANLSYVQKHLPHIAALLTEDLEAVVEHADTLVFAHKGPAARAMASTAAAGKAIVDLVRLAAHPSEADGYRGLCW